MGLILTTLNAAGSTLSDQWKEYFYCDAIPADTICVKVIRRHQVSVLTVEMTISFLMDLSLRLLMVNA